MYRYIYYNRHTLESIHMKLENNMQVRRYKYIFFLNIIISLGTTTSMRGYNIIINCYRHWFNNHKIKQIKSNLRSKRHNTSILIQNNHNANWVANTISYEKNAKIFFLRTQQQYYCFTLFIIVVIRPEM